ncbi:MAG: SAM-dependent methyltransferase, partial [Bacteroidetes bacterium]|nr:SAM-dependent methyltransferase [Bacteroidota bacterium]
AITKNQSQIFMEAPYRNNQLLEDILKTVAPNTRICIACHISSPESWIKTKSAREWLKDKPELHKKPVIFVMGA